MGFDLQHKDTDCRKKCVKLLWRKDLFSLSALPSGLYDRAAECIGIPAVSYWTS
jgi:hypothetical protein